MVFEIEREVLAGMLGDHGEDELADRALVLRNDELARIETLGSYYAFSEDARTLGPSMSTERALTLAAVDVLDGSGRELRHQRTHHEIAQGWSEDLTAEERVRDRELRRHAGDRQIPADQSKRILDILDPPAWGPAPPDATPELKRCHELRTRQLRDFTDRDLRVMIEHQVAVPLLVGRALTRLQPNPLLDSGSYPGDLLAAVLAVNAEYWKPRPDPEVAAWKLADGLYDRSDLEPPLRKLIRTFIREHPHRPVSDFPEVG